MRTWVSFWIIFGVVPEETRAWKPERAPQAMVMKTKGNIDPAKTGPSPLAAKSVTEGIFRVGIAMTTPSARSAMVPTFMKVER